MAKVVCTLKIVVADTRIRRNPVQPYPILYPHGGHLRFGQVSKGTGNQVLEFAHIVFRSEFEQSLG